MSHSSSCKHFASRTAQFDAVAGRWLAHVIAPLTKIAEDRQTPSPKRLKAWARQLAEAERKKVVHDPGLVAV